MRKAAAILLLAILLFNWCGYQLVFYYIQKEVSTRIEAKLDDGDFDNERLIEIKIPLNMPYQSNRSDFERVDGELQINGVHYKYVKRKVYNDSLILLCLPYGEKTKIEHAKADFFKLMNDLNPSSSKEASSETTHLSVKNILMDCWFAPSLWNINSLEPQLVNHKIKYNFSLSLFYETVAEQPPDC